MNKDMEFDNNIRKLGQASEQLSRRRPAHKQICSPFLNHHRDLAGISMIAAVITTNMGTVW